MFRSNDLRTHRGGVPMTGANRGKKRRHPVRWVGAKLLRDYVQVPNALVRDERVTNAAFRVAVLLRSHAEGYSTSAAAMAADLHCARGTVTSALECLEALRWLVVRDTRTVDADGLVHSEYVMHASRQFTAEEAVELARPILVARSEPARILSRHADGEDRACSKSEQDACSKTVQAKPVQELSTKEDHSEDQLEKTYGHLTNADDTSALARHDECDWHLTEPPDDDEPLERITHPGLEMTEDWRPSERVMTQMQSETGRSARWLEYQVDSMRDQRLADGRSQDSRCGSWDDEYRKRVLWAHANDMPSERDLRRLDDERRRARSAQDTRSMLASLFGGSGEQERRGDYIDAEVVDADDWAAS